MSSHDDGSRHHDHGQGTDHSEHDELAEFEAPAWEERYAGDARMWSGRPNPQLEAEASRFPPGTALDVGCGEGGDVVWLAQRGWQVTGADFAAAGLARAARRAEEAGVADRCSWWQVDARSFEPDGRTFDLVTTHFLHPPAGGMAAVLGRLAGAVAPGGHLLVVGHAPSAVFGALPSAKHAAMWRAADLLPAVRELGEGFEVLLAEERARTAVRDGVQHEIEDATLLLGRR